MSKGKAGTEGSTKQKVPTTKAPMSKPKAAPVAPKVKPVINEPFFVLSLYYKHADYDIKRYANEEALRGALENSIFEATRYGANNESDVQVTDADSLYNLALTKLIALAKGDGEGVRLAQRGYGVAEVFQGKLW